MAQQTVGLKRYTVEDATFGYWLQAWDLRHINQSRFRCRIGRLQKNSVKWPPVGAGCMCKRLHHIHHSCLRLRPPVTC